MLFFFFFNFNFKKAVNLTEDIRQATAGPRRNRWSVLRASSSRPHVPIPPNLISEALFPVAQMALRTPKTIHLRRIKSPRPHLASSGMVWQRLREEAGRVGGGGGRLEKKKVSREGRGSPLYARLLNVTGWRWDGCSRGIPLAGPRRRAGVAAASRGGEGAGRGCCRADQPRSLGARRSSRGDLRGRAGAEGEVGAGGGARAGPGGPDHMAQPSQAAWHRFLSLPRTLGLP